MSSTIKGFLASIASTTFGWVHPGPFRLADASEVGGAVALGRTRLEQAASVAALHLLVEIPTYSRTGVWTAVVEAATPDGQAAPEIVASADLDLATVDPLTPIPLAIDPGKVFPAGTVLSLGLTPKGVAGSLGMVSVSGVLQPA